jgi:competence protein ComEA
MSDELQQLPGVGPAMANRILQYRKDNRGFTSVDDLNNVNGIGPKKLEKIKPFAIVKPLPFQKQASN